MALSALFLASATSCLNVATPGVLLSTNPPGARVLIDGVDSGFATPCALSLEITAPHEISFELDGYQTARRTVVPNESFHVVPWWDGDVGLVVWRFPIFLTFNGLFLPLRQNDNVIPNRIYVPLEVATQDR